MDLLLSILITLFLVGVLLSIIYIIIGFVLEKKGSKENKEQETPQQEAPKGEENKE